MEHSGMSSEWKAKRFWKEVAMVPEDGGFTIKLDDRGVKTPAKASLVVPTRGMARAIAAEWEAQTGEIDPSQMPFTRSANAAIDKVRHQHAEVADMLAAYGDSDLLCYRAEAPMELVRRQTDAWDPALVWAHQVLEANLNVHNGVIHHPQRADSLARLSKRVHGLTEFQLAAFHDLVSLSGSLILGFGAAMNWREIDDLWQMSILDEIWQQEQWGDDEEAQAQSEVKRQAFLHAKRFFDLS